MSRLSHDALNQILFLGEALAQLQGWQAKICNNLSNPESGSRAVSYAMVGQVRRQK